MSRMLEFLAVLVRKIENLVLYFIERFSANFQALGQRAQTAIIVLVILAILVLVYIIIVILRLFFKRSLRHLKNVQYEYKVILDHQKGKKHSFINDILYFQKVIVLDEYIIRETKYTEDSPKKKTLKIKLQRKNSCSTVAGSCRWYICTWFYQAESPYGDIYFLYIRYYSHYVVIEVSWFWCDI